MDKKQDRAQYIKEWQQGNLERITIKPHRAQRLKERVQIAAAQVNQSPQKYMIEAIETRLELDGHGQRPAEAPEAPQEAHKTRPE